MVARSGRYYGNPLMDIIGVTKVDPLTYTILNIVLNVFITLWDTVVTVQAEVLEVFSSAVQTLYALLYMNDRIMASPTPGRLQTSLDVLTVLFDRVRIQKNPSRWWA